MKNKSLNIMTAAAGLSLAAAMFLIARGFPDRATSASRYVIFLSAVLALFSFLLPFDRTAKNNKVLLWIKKPALFWKTAIVTGVYALMLPYAGFFISSALYMIFLSWLLGLKKPLWVLVSTGGLLFFIYVVFVRFLTVPVPMGIWGA